jgi:hypothetical protein
MEVGTIAENVVNVVSVSPIRLADAFVTFGSRTCTFGLVEEEWVK